MIDILTSFSFQIVAVGTMILAFACGVIGTINVLRQNSLIGDAIGHAQFPGVVLAFMIVGTIDALSLLIGALIFGAFAFFVIQMINQYSKISLDASLALVLSSFFGFGMTLKSYVQGSSAYGHTGGIDDYIFGQAAYMWRADVNIILIVSAISLLIFIFNYQRIKIFIFDPVYSHMIGNKPTVMNTLILVMTIGLIAAGLKAVGVILIVNLLIAPGIIGLMWSKRYLYVTLIAGFSGLVSAFVGTYISTAYAGFATGPTIILCLSTIVLFSILFGTHGAVRSGLMRRRHAA